jgi:hypothetical protein
MRKRFSSLFIVAVFVLMFSATANAEMFTAYLEGRQEAPAVTTAATGYARILVNETTMQITYTVVFNNLSSAQTGAHLHSGARGVAGPVIIGFATPGGTSGTITGTAAITAGQLALMRQHGTYVNVHSVNNSGGEIRGQVAPRRPVDFDGDGKTDKSVLKFPATGTPRPMQFWNKNSTQGTVISPTWGDALRDFPAPGDYDGDGQDDYALYREGATLGAQSEFWILTSATNTVLYYAWGLGCDPAGTNLNACDSPMARDYDGDGKTDVAVTRRGATTGDPVTWYIRRSSNNTVSAINWGVTGASTNSFYDAPVPGDYDGDGKFDLAVYRFGTPPDNNYIVLKSSDGGSIYQPWGNFTTDYILPGDYDGDGKFDFAVGRTGATNASPMVWHILHANGTIRQMTFGITSDFPAQGDYDGDGKTDIAIFRDSTTATTQTFYWVFNSFDNTTAVTQWGVGADFSVNTFDIR